MTPRGGAIDLASPAADALGRSGFGGDLDNRFFERFGSAILLSLVDDGVYIAAQGDRLVNLRVGVKDYFQLELMGPCPDVDWTQKIALVSRGGSTICSGLDAEIVTPSPIGPQKCPVKSVRKLTPTEVATLPKGAKP